MELKILSWNIWVDCRFDELKKFLAASNADIIGLQEVRDGDTERDVIGYLTSLGYQHAAALEQFWETRGFYFGPAIFSKFDIISSRTIELSEQHRRYALQADIRIGETVLRVFNAHLRHEHQKHSDIQDLQAETLLSQVSGDRALVLGDFNATPDSTVYRKFADTLTNTDPSNTPTWSVYPEGCEVCNPQGIDTRLDYIFVTKDLKTHSPRVESSAASDHLPISVLVDL